AKLAAGVTLQDPLGAVSITITDGNVDFNGQAITLTGAFTWNSADTLTYDAVVTISGNADFTIANNGTVNISSGFVLQGTGSVIINMAMLTFTDATLAAIGMVTTVNGTQTFAVSNVLTVGAGTLTLTSAILVIPTVQVNPLIVNVAATINGTSTLALDFGGAITINIPAITTGGTVTFVLQNSTAFAGVYDINGAVSAVTLTMLKSSTGTLGINTNNNNITGSTDLLIGNANAVGAITVVFGISNGVCGNFNINDDTGVHILTFGNSLWNVSGDWTYQSNTAPTYGAACAIGFTGTPTIITANKAMP
ncbi:unnamed protein product, partial [marine sediment metagenome]